MSVETFGVVTTGGAASEADISLTGAALPSRQLDLRVWTTVTEAQTAESQPPGTPALIALDGVSRALHVRIHEAEDGVALADVDTGVFGTGDTLLEAMQDLRDALQAHLAVLSEEDALAPSLQSQLEILRNYFNIR
ncbi:MAG TPA: type II toxin-antitoxin system HicB family antitoxin [Streptosporangiaceae bacterium]|nr:type II toxin-antitoxin system HicB family antitoxin [Streptosporangiaceae bacterium]